MGDARFLCSVRFLPNRVRPRLLLGSKSAARQRHLPRFGDEGPNPSSSTRELDAIPSPPLAQSTRSTIALLLLEKSLPNRVHRVPPWESEAAAGHRRIAPAERRRSAGPHRLLAHSTRSLVFRPRTRRPLVFRSRIDTIDDAPLLLEKSLPNRVHRVPPWESEAAAGHRRIAPAERRRSAGPHRLLAHSTRSLVFRPRTRRDRECAPLLPEKSLPNRVQHAAPWESRRRWSAPTCAGREMEVCGPSPSPRPLDTILRPSLAPSTRSRIPPPEHSTRSTVHAAPAREVCAKSEFDLDAPKEF